MYISVLVSTVKKVLLRKINSACNVGFVEFYEVPGMCPQKVT